MSNAPTAKLGRTQLYSMAAVATYGTKTELTLKLTNDATIALCAVKTRDTCPPQQLKDRHDSGWAYYEINRDGVIKPLTEKELRRLR